MQLPTIHVRYDSYAGFSTDKDGGNQVVSEERLSDLIGLIYEASLRPDLWQSVLEGVAEITPAIVVMLGSHDRLSRKPAFNLSYGNDHAYLDEYIERWAASNPMIDAMALLDPGDVAGLDSLLDYAAFKQTPFFQEWARPQGYCDAINIILERTPSSIASMSVITSEAQGMSDAQTTRRLRVLAPHLRRAVRIGQVLDHSRIETQTLARTLDTLSSPIFLFGPSFDLFHANAEALDLLKKGLKIMQLQTALRACQRAPSTSGTRYSDHAHDGAFMLRIESENLLLCHATSLPITAGSPSPLTLIAVRNASSTEQASRSASALYGLTRRERDVLVGMVEVGAIETVADLLGLTKHTVRSHLKAIFQKTRTRRQSDLVKLVGTFESPWRQNNESS